MNSKLKILLITLIVILISAISFGGVYVKNLNSYTNVIKDYMLARNLKGSRVVELKVNQENEQEENITEETNVTEENAVSSEEVKLAKKILKERLKKLGSEDYIIQQNDESGDITISLNEDDLTDTITGYLTSVGDFKIVDSEDKDNVLVSNEHIKDVKVGYASDTAGTTVYLSIEFNKEGKQKLEEISESYTPIEEITNETANEVASEEVTKETETEKKVTLMIDNTEIMSTSFEEPVTNGVLQMSIGETSTNVADLQTYLTQANGMAVILNAGKMPFEYTMEKNEYVRIDEQMVNNIKIAIIALIVLALVACIVLIIKYKSKGLKMVISFIGMIAIFLLLIRYANVYIAMESIVAFIGLIIINTYINWLILKNNKENKIFPSILNAYKKSAKITILVLVVTVILCFIPWTPISNIGMLLFWGLISMIIATFAITLPILKESK